jgi:tetratricopeptide (TPR) repeat protein
MKNNSSLINVGNSIDNTSLVINVLDSYQQMAESLRDSITSGKIAADFQNGQNIIEESFSVKEKLLMHGFSNARNRGLLAARRGELTAAAYYFEVAQTPLNKKELSYTGALIYESFLEQAKSYLLCRSGEFEQARMSIDKSLSNDIALEQYSSRIDLTLHRIQLVHNLVRLEAYCGNINYAIELACQILRYLSGTSEFIGVMGDWGYQRVKNQDPSEISAMFAQVTGEIAIILAGKPRQFKTTQLNILSQISIPDSQYCHKTSAKWLILQQELVNNNVMNFLNQLSDFLRDCEAESALLSSAALVDLVILCEELQLDIIADVKQKISKDADLWQHVPNKKISNYLTSLSDKVQSCY